MNEPLVIALADAARFLEAQKVRYALIGGLAVMVRGRPRATVDIDFTIAMDVDRALQIVNGLSNTPFAPLFDGVEDVIQRSFILPLRHRQEGIKVDIALGLSGFERQAIHRAELINVLGVSVPVVTAEDLLLMKALAGRPQDEQDLQGLVDAHGANLDWTYCLNVALELGDSLGEDLATRIRTMRDTC